MSENVIKSKKLTVTIDDKPVEVMVKRPGIDVESKGNLIYSREFARLVKPEDGRPGAIVRSALDNVLRHQGLWDDDKQKAWEEINKRLLESEKKLARGGMKLTEARSVAIQMRRDRIALRALLADRSSLDSNTAEAQAEQAKFNYFVSAMTVYFPSGKQFFKNEEDYLLRAGEPAVQEIARAFGQVYYNLEDNFEKTLPENKFLLKYKLVREKDLHLVDKDGKLVNAENRRVDEKGRLINENGDLIDYEGNLLTEEGDYKVEFSEFIDDFHDASPAVKEPDAEAATA